MVLVHIFCKNFSFWQLYLHNPTFCNFRSSVRAHLITFSGSIFFESVYFFVYFLDLHSYSRVVWTNFSLLELGLFRHCKALIFHRKTKLHCFSIRFQPYKVVVNTRLESPLCSFWQVALCKCTTHKVPTTSFLGGSFDWVNRGGVLCFLCLSIMLFSILHHGFFMSFSNFMQLYYMERYCME